MRRICWIDHVRRIYERLLKKILYGEIQRGKRKVGRPLLQYSDSVKQDIVKGNITKWEENTENGCRVSETEWRSKEKERLVFTKLGLENIVGNTKKKYS